MAIVCTPSVSAAQQAKGQEHKAAGHTQTAENQARGNPFLALLQGAEALASAAVAQNTEGVADAALVAAGHREKTLDTAKSDAAQEQGHEQEALLSLSDWKILSEQIPPLDTQASQMQPMHLSQVQQAQPMTHFHLGQPPQGLLTASLGVQQDWSAASSAAGATALAEMTQQEAASVREQDMQAALEQANFEPTGSEAERVQASDAAPGRIALQGMQEVSSASLQAQAPQVAQWVAQWLASPRQTVTPSAGTAAADAADPHALAGLQEGGGRLTEQAVQATQASADAQLADTQAQEQARQEDLRFWLRGQQQRAEVVLQRDGQPVRVQVQIQGQEAHVVLRTDQEAMRTLLGEGLEQLRAMLSQQGVQLAGVDVQADGGRQTRVPLAPSGWGNAGRSTVQVAPGDLPAVPSAARVRGQLNVYV